MQSYSDPMYLAGQTKGHPMIEAVGAIVVLVIALFIVTRLFAMGMWIVWTLLAGLVVGAIARVVLRGKARLGWISTSLYGIGGSFLGKAIGGIFGFGGILTFALSVVIAAILIYFIHLSKNR
ncbi:MAG: putative membrane protein YeaQ/YmgE (transglycosylase-associated protein family) [Myxococcota bacterium]|jgi:uncharacterized membrane protein YeaQ/YmgE (transglycosylase-associated protein family)